MREDKTMTREQTIQEIRNIVKHDSKYMAVCINGFTFNLQDFKFHFGEEFIAIKYRKAPFGTSICYNEITNIY